MADLQRKTANLFDKTAEYTVGVTTYNYTISGLDPNKYYTCSTNFERISGVDAASIYFNGGNSAINGVWSNTPRTFKPDSNGEIIVYIRYLSSTDIAPPIIDDVMEGTIWVMVNEGSTPLPYEPYGWLHSLRKLATATDTFTTLPADIYADGNNATVGISGNTVQNGTPTPDNPIMPQGTGERTGNLFDKNNVNYFNGYYVSDSNSIREYPNNAMLYVPITVGVTYTISGIKRYDTSVTQRYFLTSVVPANQVQVVRNFAQAQNIPLTFTAGTDENYLGIMICGDSDYAGYGSVAAAINANSEDIMLNLGSTALPYEPYGIKIPISSASTTTPVYLGEVESTRQIKKLVLTGDVLEQWEYVPVGTLPRFRCAINALAQITQCVCTHYRYELQNADGNIFVNSTLNTFTVCDSNFTSLEQWKSYLAAQYAAGNPVTVWYVLAEPTTGIVNEPIRKIGEYADTVSGITIPTIAGANSFDVLTTLKPSEVTVNYKGWHTGAVHERENGAWT